jgi:DNA replication regulator SLD3
MGNTPAVVIAKCGDGKSIFVVERVEQNLYAVCKLGSWVSLSRLCAGAIISRPQQSKVGSGPETGHVTHEDQLELQITPESSKYSKKKRLAIQAIQSMVKRPLRDGLSTPLDEAESCPQSCNAANRHPSGDLGSEGIQEDINTRPKAAEIFDNIRLQYFEALYLSKVRFYLTNNLVLVYSSIGIACIFCKRTTISSSCCFSSGL